MPVVVPASLARSRSPIPTAAVLLTVCGSVGALAGVVPRDLEGVRLEAAAGAVAELQGRAGVRPIPPRLRGRGLGRRRSPYAFWRRARRGFVSYLRPARCEPAAIGGHAPRQSGRPRRGGGSRQRPRRLRAHPREPMVGP